MTRIVQPLFYFSLKFQASKLFVWLYRPVCTLYTVDATEYVTAQIDATFHEGRGKWRAVS